MTENEELKKAALQLKAMVICTSIKTHRSCSECVNENDCGKDEYDTDKVFAKSANIIFDALEELESYQSIDTIDEFKSLKEKNEPKKPILNNPKINEFYIKEAKLCPACHSYINNCSGYYCRDCGQRINWSE